MGVWRLSTAGLEFVTPVGMRDEDGNIIPLAEEKDTEDNGPLPHGDAIFKGMEEMVPRHIGQLVR